MKLKFELYESLKKLTPPFFDELRFQLDIPSIYLLPSEAPVPYVTRAMELITYLENKPGGLEQLKKLLDDLNFYHNFLPQGAFPVGPELFRREEAKEREAMAEADARGEDPGNYRVTPEKFYTFKPESEWLGILRNWDCPRSFHTELFNWVLGASKRGLNCPAAAIIGPGGSGKSVSFRRLAVDLAQQGQKVWWVEEPERLLMYGWSQLEIMGGVPSFLFLDNIQHLERDFVHQLQRKLQKNPSLILLVAGRSLPRALRARIGPRAGLFSPEEAGDHCVILRKIAATIPEWADIAHQLAVEPLQQARLIRLLVVLARQKAAPQNLEDIETAFLLILSDDTQRIRDTLPGLAEAVIDAAAFRELGIDISRETVIALADHYQPNNAIPIQLEKYAGNQRWHVVDSLIFYYADYDVMRFLHDELAEGLIKGGRQGLLGSRVIGDDSWRKTTLGLVIQKGSHYSSSNFLGRFVLNRLETIGKELALVYIHKLLEAGNSHQAYLRLIIHDSLPLDLHERLKLLLQAARVAPFNNRFWGTVWSWIQRSFPDKEERKKILQKLYQAGCQASGVLIPLIGSLPLDEAKEEAKKLLERLGKNITPDVLCRCLDLLGEEAKDRARELLKDKNITPNVLCRCLDLLGEEAKDRAKILLEINGTHPDVLCRCVELLGAEAQNFALERIRHWRETKPSLLLNCLKIASRTTETAQMVEEMLMAWDNLPAQHRVAALRVHSDNPLRIQFAKEILKNWHQQFRPLVAAALNAFWDNPDEVTEYCRTIINRWHSEIFYKIKRRQWRYDGHIIKALSHPALRIESLEAASNMLSVEAESPGFLTFELFKVAKNIVQRHWLPWSEKEEMEQAESLCDSI